jgi:hypothetical protein
MRAVVLGILALLVQGQQRAKDFFDRIEFEVITSDSDEERKVLDVLQKSEHWIGAYRAIETKFGAFPDNLAVKVNFSLKGVEAGWGAGQGAEGRIRFNLKVLGDIQRKRDEIELKRKESQSRGATLVTKVPPAKIDRVIYHELTHVLQREFKAPDWFNEGMAQYLADDPNNLYGFAYHNKPVQEIDAVGVDRGDMYARGHLFWKWLDSRDAVKKVVALTLFDRKEWKAALEEGTGFPWVTLVLSEKAWSEGELQKYKVK